MDAETSRYVFKVTESLAGAQSEFAAGRYNNCANRCYYACFQAAIAALERANVRPGSSEWSHAFVWSQFEGLLIRRRKVVPTSLRGTLSSTHEVRRIADYGRQSVSRWEAQRVLRAATMLVQTSQGQEAHA